MSTIVIDARIISSSTGTYVRQLLEHLQDIDSTNDYTVLVRKKDASYWQPRASNFSVRVAEFDNYSFAEQIGFKRFLDDIGPDLVHFCMPQQPVLYRGKKVTTFHDLTLLNTYNSDKNLVVFKLKQFVGRFVFKRVARDSMAVLTPTKYTRDALMKLVKLPTDRITVTYEAAEYTPKRTEQYEPLPFKRFILYVGQQPDYKNIRRLGEAHQILLEKHPDLGLLLVGKKAADTVANETYFRELGYKQIHFTGFIPDEQRDWLMQSCETYVFPSLMEGFGLPGLEAMAAGAPVVSSGASCLPEVYGEAAQYFDPTDAADMARAIETVISDESVRSELTRKGTAKVREYSWRRMAEQTHAIYERSLPTE